MFINTNLFFSGSKNMKTNNNNLNLSSQFISQSLNLQFQKQSQDIDHYIRLQNEKPRMMLQEQRKQQVALLLKKVDSDVIYMLRQKDEEIAQAAKKRMELEEFLSQLEEENKAWCKEAQEKEAIALSLHNTLEQVKNGVVAEDARSCCNEEEGETRRGTVEEEVKAE